MKQLLNISLLVLGIAGANLAESIVYHGLSVEIFPAKKAITVTDTLHLPQELLSPKLAFSLHSGLHVECLTPNVTLTMSGHKLPVNDVGMDLESPSTDSDIRQNQYLLSSEKPLPGKIILAFRGVIHHSIQQLSEEYQRSFSVTPGIIDSQGVYLAGSSLWIPQIDNTLLNFKLKITLPGEWDALSQGKVLFKQTQGNKRQVIWKCTQPMEEAFLIAGAFHTYQQRVGKVDIFAWLRSPDAALAQKYLDVTGQYLEMYQQLIGPYPFSKFALVENFWETGYGMPSFTLLGPQVIRFPFILHSSYPHELLHNWWGNSAYVDFQSGNWCEGATVYMADHLIAEQRGQGDDYRRTTLQKFTDYVNLSNDFPLTEFLSRTDAASEAIGYGKAMMLWEMLRTELGDSLFVKAFQDFYQNNQYRKASYADLQNSFEKVSGRDFAKFFAQWTQRTGAPELHLNKVKSRKKGSAHKLTLKLAQTQKEAPFELLIPVAFYFENRVEIKTVQMDKRKQKFVFTFQDKPIKVVVDPQFQVFRKLHSSETPATLSTIFGAEKALIILPDELSQEDPHQILANTWSENSTKNIEVKKASALDKLPSDRSVWLFGDINPFLKEIEKLWDEYGVNLESQRIILEKAEFPIENHSFVVAMRHPLNPKQVFVWLRAANSDAAKGLARKLPHYGKYSYLVFDGDEPTNVAKGQWPSIHSPLQKLLSAEKIADNVQLPNRPALGQLPILFSAERMMEDINFLAAPECEGRGLGSQGIERASDYIAQQFEKAGLLPAADDGSFFQSWRDIINAQGDSGVVKNVIALLPGSNPQLKDEALVICAHYDHLGYGWPDVRAGNEGKMHLGADDNASGVAVILELARVLKSSFTPERSILFVAFTAEENQLSGSRHFVSHYKRFPKEKLYAALNIDSVGRLKDGKFLILNASSAKEWPFIFMGIGYTTGVQTQIVTQQLDASDQVAFIEAGIPAVQIFSGIHEDYHRPTDTPDKIDAAGLAKAATLSREALVYLAAERKEALTMTGQAKPAHPANSKSTSERKVSTGLMPDFTYDGEGVKIQAVSQDSPAEKAELQPGDILIEINGQSITDLRDYSNQLKTQQSGDIVKFKILRGETMLFVELTLSSR